MLAKRATTLACALLALVAVADVTVVVAVLITPHQRYRVLGASVFILLTGVTVLMAWRLWRRGRWAYRLALGVCGLFLLGSAAAFSRHQESLAGLTVSLVLMAALLAAYPEFRVPSKPLYLTPSER